MGRVAEVLPATLLPLMKWVVAQHLPPAVRPSLAEDLDHVVQAAGQANVCPVRPSAVRRQLGITSA